MAKKFAGLPRSTGRTTGPQAPKTPRDPESNPTFDSGRTLSLGAKNRVINKDITRLKLKGSR